MGVIKIESIQQELPEGWKLISTSYKNLDSGLEFECPAGHKVYSNWKKMRVRAECPICKEKAPLVDTTVIPKKKGIYRTIGIDQATHISGYSVYDEKELVKFGTFTVNETNEIERDNTIKMWLCSIINNWQPDVVGLEGIQLQQNAARNIGVTTFETLARLQGILMEACYEQKVPFVICPTNTWRAHCKVKGQTREAKKNSMRQLAREWHGINASEDEADAIGIGKYVAETYALTHQLQSWE